MKGSRNCCRSFMTAQHCELHPALIPLIAADQGQDNAGAACWPIRPGWMIHFATTLCIQGGAGGSCGGAAVSGELNFHGVRAAADPGMQLRHQ